MENHDKIKLAPIVIFAYNRPIHLRQTVEALLKNELAAESDLIIYSDGAKTEQGKANVDKTREYIKSITGFKSLRIVEREKNFGLANNIIDGVTSIVNEFGRIIVLEDDLLTSPYFLKFMNEALNKYEDTDEIVSVHGYLYPIKADVPTNFILKHTDSLGWGTWRKSWTVFNSDGQSLLEQIKKQNLQKEFNFNNTYNFTKMLENQVLGKNNSWAIRWYASSFLSNKLSLFSGKSLVFHNGNDLGSSNSSYGDSFWLDVELSNESIPLIDVPICENQEMRLIYSKFFHSTFSLQGKIRKKIKDIYGKFLYNKRNNLTVK